MGREGRDGGRRSCRKKQPQRQHRRQRFRPPQKDLSQRGVFQFFSYLFFRRSKLVLLACELKRVEILKLSLFLPLSLHFKTNERKRKTDHARGARRGSRRRQEVRSGGQRRSGRRVRKRHQRERERGRGRGGPARRRRARPPDRPGGLRPRLPRHLERRARRRQGDPSPEPGGDRGEDVDRERRRLAARQRRRADDDAEGELRGGGKRRRRRRLQLRQEQRERRCLLERGGQERRRGDPRRSRDDALGRLGE